MKTENEWITKDSGHRRVFATGAQRDRSKGKGRFDLISPFALKRLAGLYERGAEKYSERNFEKGIPLSQYLDSAIRHLFQVLEGREDEDHVAAVIWNAVNYIHTEELIKRGLLPQELTDLPSYEPVNNNEEIQYRQTNKLKDKK